ncbi:MAG: siderophore-interacting protein [Neisseriaceae bacterium]|nr:siderophore-interacting protein [Neisseriaceae bacterium]MBP6861844.1 siderophore-interacting protein [Neisseriaceae bacterium]
MNKNKMKQKVRQPTAMTVLATVVGVDQVTPLVRRLTFGGEALKAVVANGAFAEPAAWVKLFAPLCHGRAYSIRQQNRATGTIDIDFVLHSHDEQRATTVSAWAEAVAVGTEVLLSYPARGGFTVNRFAKWLWMAADATALPALQSVLADLPLGLDVRVMVFANGVAERQALVTKAELTETWLYPQEEAYEAALKQVLADAAHLAGQGQVWLAGESNWVKNWQLYWLRERGLTPKDILARGYWKQGEADYKDQRLLVS